MSRDAAALRAHPFEPAFTLTPRLDRAGRPIRTCRICGRPGRGSGHRLGGLTPEPAGKVDAQRERRATVAPRLVADLVAHARGDRHAFDPDPDRRVQAANGTSWAACRVCGKDRRAHPRRTAAERAQAAPVPVMAADTSNGSRPSPGPSAASQGRSRAKVLPAAELVALALAVDRILALPIDLVGWKLRMRLVGVREVLNVPEYPTLDVAELPGEVDPDPTTDRILANHPDLAPRPMPVDQNAAQLALLRGIRNDRVRTLAQRAVAAGGRLSMTGSGHLAIDVGRQRVVVSTTMGDGRRGHTWGNVKATAKRAGIDVTGL